MKKYLSITFLLGLMWLLVQCGAAAPSGSPGLKVMDAWARQSPAAAGNGAVYMKLVNDGGADDILLGVKSDVAEVAELHETKMDGGMMKMSPVPNIKIPAGGSVSLEPGGLHVMLINLKQPLEPGQKVKLTLTFGKAAPIIVEAEVRAIGADMPQMGQ
jgi:copper(I)-binding protein